MKNCKKIFVCEETTLGAIIRKTGFPFSKADAFFQVSVKDNTLIIKPTVTAFQAEKLANVFLIRHLKLDDDFEVNPRQRVIACAAGRHVGVAYCSKEDDFNVTIGKALALSRATRIPLPPLLQTYLGLN